MDRQPRPSREVERLVRYCHPAKILGTTRLPGVDSLGDAELAALYGISRESYLETRAAIRAEVVAGAGGLAPLRLAGPVLALGDSHTDDLGSWAAILGELAGVRVINAGLSGDTTTSARARLHRLPPATHALVLLGTNDARRHGNEDVLVSDRETRRNIQAIDAFLRPTHASVVWITPPPVDARRIRADPWLLEANVAWRLADVERKAAIVRDVAPDAVDLWPSFRAEHLAADGLHPSAAGQRLIAQHVLARLSAGTQQP